MQNLLKKPAFWATLIMLVLLVMVAGYWYQLQQATTPEEPQAQTDPAPPQVAPPIAATADEGAVKHPLPASPMTLTTKEEAEKDKAGKLPPPDDSDALVTEIAAQLLGSANLAKFFQTGNMVRRLVAAVDNLPREKIASRLNPIKPIEGSLATIGEADSLALSPGNFSRYGPFVTMFSALDVRRIVDAYIRYYPLFQQEYKALGYPNRYFNDRLIEAIDDLLAAPEPSAPVRLVQPKVQYQFADPALESLSYGRKAMVRIGSENAARVKSKLREFRAALIAASAARPRS